VCECGQDEKIGTDGREPSRNRCLCEVRVCVLEGEGRRGRMRRRVPVLLLLRDPAGIGRVHTTYQYGHRLAICTANNTGILCRAVLCQWGQKITANGRKRPLTAALDLRAMHHKNKPREFRPPVRARLFPATPVDFVACGAGGWDCHFGKRRAAVWLEAHTLGSYGWG